MSRRPARADRRRDVHGREYVALVTAAEAAALDEAARTRYGVPERVLMENAGRAAATILDRLFPRGRVLALAGGGNNGGDALVMMRVLRSWGRDVAMIAAGSRAPDPALLHGFRVPLETAEDAARAMERADVLVDGLLGTGSRGAPRDDMARLIERANASGRPIVALDLPSGVDATTGRVPGAAVRASVTVTFGWPKLGCMLQPARGCCGRLIAVEIGFPPLEPEVAAGSAELDVAAGAGASSASSRAALITGAWAAARVPPRAADSHKGTAGRLLILAGREGMAGAAALAAEAAKRAGAGLLRLASAGANRGILQTLVPEATFADYHALEEADLSSMHAMVAGPGLGADEDVRAILDGALEWTGKVPVLLDADALNVLSDEPDALSRIAAKRPVVITPHPKELERLSGTALDAILDDRVGAARAASARFGCVVLLKGQPSLIAAPDGRLLVNSLGSSDLAAGGMGDQLSGVIGAFLAAGARALDAAAAGLYLSARAADHAARGRSLGPRDISEHFHEALARPAPNRPSLRLPFVTFDQPERW